MRAGLRCHACAHLCWCASSPSHQYVPCTASGPCQPAPALGVPPPTFSNNLSAPCTGRIPSDLLLPALHHRLVEGHPDKAVSWFAVGCYYMCTQQYEAARRHFGKATTLDRRFVPAWIGFGHAFAAQDESDQVRGAGGAVWVVGWVGGMSVGGVCARVCGSVLPSLPPGLCPTAPSHANRPSHAPPTHNPTPPSHPSRHTPLPAQAMAAYRTANRLFPGLHTPLLGMGMEYQRMNNLQLAEQMFLQVCVCGGGVGSVWVGMGRGGGAKGVGLLGGMWFMWSLLPVCNLQLAKQMVLRVVGAKGKGARAPAEHACRWLSRGRAQGVPAGGTRGEDAGFVRQCAPKTSGAAPAAGPYFNPEPLRPARAPPPAHPPSAIF